MAAYDVLSRASELSFLLTDTAAILGYYVIGCNAEWEERFVRTETGWMRLSDSP